MTVKQTEGILTALALQSVDNVEGSDGLSLGVLSVGDGITDDTLEEGLENTTGLLVDHGRDTLDTTTTRETADSGLGDTLDVVTQNLTVTLGTTLAETLSTFATYWRDASVGMVHDPTKPDEIQMDDRCCGEEKIYLRPVIVKVN